MGTKKLTVVITGDSASAEKALDAVAAKSESFGDKLKSGLGGALSVFGGEMMTRAFDGVKDLVTGSVAAAAESAKIARETERVIRTTGGAANVSADQVGDLATKLSTLTGVDDEVVQSTSNMLLTFTNVRNEVGKGNDVFDQATGLALDMAQVMGTDSSAAAIQLGKALNDPVKGVTALAKAGVSFTDQQKDQIQALVKSGDLLGAQKIVLAELSKEFGGAAEAASTPMEKLQVIIGNFQEQVGGYMLPAVEAASTWLGERLPGAIDVASAKADELIAAATPIATEVFAQILDTGRQVGERLGPAFEDLGRIIGTLVDYSAPAASALAHLVGEGTLDGIVTLAGGIQDVTHLLAENTEVVKLAADVGFAYLGLRAASALAELAASNTIVPAVAAHLSNLVGNLRYAQAAFLEVSASQGAFAATGQALSYYLSSAAVRVGIAAAAIYAFTSRSDEGREAADRFVASLNINNFDVKGAEKGLQSIEDRIRSMNDTLNNASIGDKLASFADIVIPFHDVAGSIHDVSDEQNRLVDTFEGSEKTVQAQNKAFSELAAKLAESQSQSSGMTMSADQLAERLKAIAGAEKIDITAPDAAQKLTELYNSTTAATPAQNQLADAFKVTADQTANAEDKVKAYKDALDALTGAHLGAWDAQTKATQALKELGDLQLKGKGMFDLNTEAAGKNNAELFKNRAALSDAVQSSVDHATAVYNESGSLDAANLTLLQHRRQLVDVVTQLTGNKAAAETYINQLGLTPDQIGTLVQLNAAQARNELAGTQGQIDRVGQGTTATIYANITPAEQNLARLGFVLNDLERRVFRANVDYDSGMRPHAEGGIDLYRYAMGGEHHVAQFAPAGAWRLWAEPETGGEAYIPLSPGKRGRSTAILSEVADMFGYELSRSGGRQSSTPPQAAPGAGTRPTVIQLVVDRRVLAEVVADGTRQREGTLR